MTPRDGLPPYTVTIHDGSQVNKNTFDSHDDACVYAIEQLRRATASDQH